MLYDFREDTCSLRILMLIASRRQASNWRHNKGRRHCLAPHKCRLSSIFDGCGRKSSSLAVPIMCSERERMKLELRHGYLMRWWVDLHAEIKTKLGWYNQQIKGSNSAWWMPYIIHICMYREGYNGRNWNQLVWSSLPDMQEIQGRSSPVRSCPTKRILPRGRYRERFFFHACTPMTQVLSESFIWVLVLSRLALRPWAVAKAVNTSQWKCTSELYSKSNNWLYP